ncbi:MAG: tRNA pseudouridine(65) synthase TruC [Helicobacteraceae bacterium]|nr:tRNA pseudouridine(65) synthase TruC [Candidatus Sulfurimonas ponti]MBL6973612.1 tRNA pseudouridine(65) synthase TruC [Sulfurimonas sp.]
MFENYELEIIYRDEHYIAINKPSGLLVHKSMIDRHEIYFAMKMLRDQIGQWVYPIHRLDKPTSGVLLFALDSESARLMSEEFKAKNIEKKYIAIVRGYIEEEGSIDYPLSVKLDKIADKKASEEKEAEEAQTSFVRLAKVELNHAVGRYDTTRYSLVELSPKTGRKHQLRRHMKHLSHHILGDTKYGRGEHNKMVREHYNCHRLMLHAKSLEFFHPYFHKRIVLKAGLDETWEVFKSLFSYLEDV